MKNNKRRCAHSGATGRNVFDLFIWNNTLARKHRSEDRKPHCACWILIMLLLLRQATSPIASARPPRALYRGTMSAGRPRDARAQRAAMGERGARALSRRSAPFPSQRNLYISSAGAQRNQRQTRSYANSSRQLFIRNKSSGSQTA